MLGEQVTAFVQELRGADLHKMAGVSETLDWVAALVALDQHQLDEAVVEETLGILLKDHDDIEAMRGERVRRSWRTPGCKAVASRAVSGQWMPERPPRPTCSSSRGRFERAGVAVRAGGVPDAIRALDVVGLTSRRDVRDALRAVLISRHEDLASFDRMFERFWRVWPDGVGARCRSRCTCRHARARTVRMLAPGSGVGRTAAIALQSSDERPVTRADLQPGRDLAPEGLRRLHAGRCRRWPKRPSRSWPGIPAYGVTRRWVPGPGRRSISAACCG